VEEKSLDIAQTDVAKQRLHTRGVGHLPVGPEEAARELAEGERALRASGPRNRRWKALDKHDDVVDRLTQKRTDAGARLQSAEEAVRQAPERDARTLAAWIAAGEKGARPPATVYERTVERDAAALLVSAVVMELDAALERRQEHVEKHRQAMLEDATGDLEAATNKLRAASQALVDLRQQALDVRALVEWVASYPDYSQSYGFPGALCVGLQAPVERTLGTKARIDFGAVVEALGEDASCLRNRFGREVAHALGLAKPDNPTVTAMWDADVDPAWKREQLERAREIAGWSASPDRVAAEASDFRQ